jgi:hypothetical protein
VGREVRVVVRYKEEEIAWQRLDMPIDGKVIVEINAIEELLPKFHRLVSLPRALIRIAPDHPL